MVARHMDTVAAVRDPDVPALVAFPEAIGMPLLFGLRFADLTASAPTVATAVSRILNRTWREVLGLGLRHRTLGLHLLYLLQWRAVYDTYLDTFRAAAREARAYIVAGSLYGPPVDAEARRGIYLEAARARNFSYTFNPAGRALCRTAKVHFVPAERRGGLTAGRVEDLQPVHTSLGRVGVAICLDGFHEGVLQQFDRAGTDILVQPSANDAAWLAPWEFDETVTQEEQWWAEGLPTGLAGRESLRYGINPMLVGHVFDMGFEGRSTICADHSRVDGAWIEREGILAVAPDPAASAIVASEVQL